jgi:hypothetical protein
VLQLHFNLLVVNDTIRSEEALQAAQSGVVMLDFAPSPLCWGLPWGMPQQTNKQVQVLAAWYQTTACQSRESTMHPISYW